MRGRILRFAVVGLSALVLGLAVVFGCAAAIGGLAPALALAGGYLSEARRLADCCVAVLTPFGPKDEDYRVYSAAMQVMFPTAAEFPPVYLVTDWPDDVRPIPAPQGICFNTVAPSLDLLRDFKGRNQMRWGLSRRFQPTRPTNLLRPTELSREELGAPVERVELSRVGYDGNGNALLYLAHYCGLCGGGYYLVLTRNSNHDWTVVDGCMMWVS